MLEPRQTESLCPQCLKTIPATIHEQEGKVHISKECPEHGAFSDLYWGDSCQFARAENYGRPGKVLVNPRTVVERGCPGDCGLCPDHRSHTILGIVDVTNRCNLRCPVCFAHAGAAGYLYEPTREQIEEMLGNLLSNSPVKPPALQFSGGEPTVREDLPELIGMAREMGFGHIEVDSNGVRIAQDPEYCRTLREAGTATVYLQFDGVTPGPYLATRGHDLLPIKVRAIENLRAAGFRSIVLVPTIVGGVNDNEIGGIIRFAIENRDVVRCVNFQPVAITGRIGRRERERMRITIPDLMRLAEEQTGGLIAAGDWYPVPSAYPVTKFVGHMTGHEYIDFAAHPHCGMASYLVVEGDEVKPIGRYFDVDDFLEGLDDANHKLQYGRRTHAKLALARNALANVDLGVLRKYVAPIFLNGDYASLGDFHHRMIMIGSMHFMDPYNFDLERVRKCVIHYAVPDGRIIPFCTMNTVHRREIERRYARPLDPSKMTPEADIEDIVSRIEEEGPVPRMGQIHSKFP